MGLLVDKVDVATQGWPSAQQDTIVVDLNNNGLLYRINNGTNTASKALKKICVEMSAPELARTVFGSTIPLPPAGYKYTFADTTLEGSPLVTVNSAGEFVTQDALTFITESTEDETVSIDAPVILGVNESGIGYVAWGDSQEVGFYYNEGSNILDIRASTRGGTEGTLRLNSLNIYLGGALSEMSLFGATPVTQPSALTTKNTSAFSSGGTEAMTDADKVILDNMRTRINELETKLTALGALAV